MTVDEAAFSAATTVGDLSALLKPLDGSPSAAGGVTTVGTDAQRDKEAIAFPAWNRSLPVRAIRQASLPTWILPLVAHLRADHRSGARQPPRPEYDR